MERSGEGLKSKARAVAKAGVTALLVRLPSNQRERVKEYFELRFWKGVHNDIATLDPAGQAARLEHEKAHYPFFFMDFFGLTPEDFAGKKLLDIGCGPMGSLEWADMAAERVGLDPLADRYLALGASKHAMRYVKGVSESIPFPDGHFDVVSTFNSLDHVADVDATIREIMRVTGPGGTILLITEIDHDPTFTEPHHLTTDIAKKFEPAFDTVSLRTFGTSPDYDLYAGMRAGLVQQPGEPGLLALRLRRR